MQLDLPNVNMGISNAKINAERGMSDIIYYIISWVVANHENNEIKTPRIFCRFTVPVTNNLGGRFTP